MSSKNKNLAPMCSAYFDEKADTLKQDWGKRMCWMNPPFAPPENPCKPNCKKKKCLTRGCIDKYIPGQIDFVKKAYDEAFLNGSWVVCLVPSRTDTACRHDYLMRSTGMMFYRGRNKFKGAKDAAPFPCTIFVLQPYKAMRTPQVILSLKDLEIEFATLVRQWKRNRHREAS